MQNKIEINNTQHKTSLYNYILLIFKVLCSYCITLYILVGFKKTIRSSLVAIVPFTLKSTSKLRFSLHFSYSIVISCFIPYR